MSLSALWRQPIHATATEAPEWSPALRATVSAQKRDGGAGYRPQRDSRTQGRPWALFPLHEAAKNGDIMKLRNCLNSSGKDMPVDSLDQWGQTPLHVAVKHRQVATAAALIDAGANPVARDREFDIPKDDLWTLNQELMHRWTDWCDVKSGEGKTAIYHMRIRDLLDKVVKLLYPAAKARLITLLCEEIERREGFTALHWAAQKNFKDLGELICSMKHVAIPTAPVPEAQRTLFVYDRDLPPALARAPYNRTWVATKVDPVTYDGLEKTPLLRAALGGHAPMVQLLLDQKGCVNSADVDGKTPLIAAASGGRGECVRILLENHAKVDTRTTRGQTALHEAAFYGHFDCVQHLLARGAEVQELAMDGTDHWRCNKTAEEMARRNKHFAVATLLEEARKSLEA